MNVTTDEHFSIYSILTGGNLKYIIIGFGGILLCLAFIIIVRFLLKRRRGNEGEQIEEAIDQTNPAEVILNQSRRASREDNYRKAIIYLFYAFRQLTQEHLSVRNALTCSPEKLVANLRGTQNLSINELDEFVEYYSKARFTKKEIFLEDYKESKNLFYKIKKGIISD
jgi:hypothetical protein